MDDVVQIPGYRIEKLLGKGAMATVYLAIQESLERKVALKIMAPSLIADATFCKRFLKEGKIVGQLNHPNIITIYDTGVYESRYYMAMEYITGGTLKERIQEDLSTDQILDILCQIAGALGYAHKRGFVHRDVKPANILFRDYGAAVLSDFGIAKSFNDASQITAVGWTVGTPNYMSPEQALGKTVDARSDLYSLGIVLYEMLTGSRPYHSEDSFAIALMHVQSPIPRLPEKFATYQPIIDTLLAKDPNDRFGSAEAFIQAIDQLRSPNKIAAAGKGLKRMASPARDKAKRTLASPRFRRPVWLLGGLAIATVGIAIYFSLPQLQEWFNTGEKPDLTGPVNDKTCPTLTSAIQAQIDDLLRVAELHLRVGRLTAPASSNALENYRRVLELDPCNTEAEAGLKEIANTYETMARRSMEEQKPLQNSLDLVQAGLSAVPDHQGLRDLEENLTRRISTSSSP